MSRFTLIQSNSLEALSDRLIDRCFASQTQDVFQPEYISVATRGVSEWLTRRIADRVGIASNIEMPFPQGIIHTLLFDWLGIDRERNILLLEKENLRWFILSELDGLLEKPAFSPIQAYLKDDEGGLKRFQLAGKIAEVFDRYLLYRPEMMQRWSKENGDDRWQPMLWRAILSKQLPDADIAHLPKLAEKAMKAQAAPSLKRISLFAIPVLAPLYIQLLYRFSEKIDIDIYLLAPTGGFVADMLSDKEMHSLKKKMQKSEAYLANQMHFIKGNRLLMNFSKQFADYQGQLFSIAGDIDFDSPDCFREPEGESMLSWLRRDIFNAERREGDANKITVAQDDASIRIHNCHSPIREIEVLHEQLIDIFENDNDISPEDVIVMTPHIDQYAPIIEAIFNKGGVKSGREAGVIPFRVLDRSIRRQAEGIDAFMSIVELFRKRMYLREVLDVLELPLVHSRFGLSEDELAKLETLLDAAGVRWGQDEAHRKYFKQPETNVNTWAFGLTRLMLGYAMPLDERALFDGWSPYDEIEGGETACLGGLSEFIELLFSFDVQSREKKSISEWVSFFKSVMETMVSGQGKKVVQHHILINYLDDIEKSATVAGFEQKVSLQVAKILLGGLMEEGVFHKSKNFTGVTFSHIQPMRSVPFKVVCLLGINDGDFPRLDKSLGFDEIAQAKAEKTKGDPSKREEDKRTFLEALLQAKKRLVISYVGQNMKDNSIMPPSVLISELLDVLNDSFRYENAPALKPADAVVVKHPLQAFNPKYFHEAGDRRLVSYAKESFQGATALQQGKKQAPSFFDSERVSEEAKAKSEPEEAIALDELISFFQFPPDYFMRSVIGARLYEISSIENRREPLALDSLQTYLLGEGILQMLDDQMEKEEIYEILKAGGGLPIGLLGRRDFEESFIKASRLFESVQEENPGERLKAAEVDIALPGGERITGRLDNIYSNGLFRVEFADNKPKRAIAHWIRHLALSALDSLPEGMVERKSTLVLKDDKLVFQEAAENAKETLETLVSLFRRGLQEPLPFFPIVSKPYAEKIPLDERSDTAKIDAIKNAEKLWKEEQIDKPYNGVVTLKKLFGDTYSPFKPAFKVDEEFHRIALAVIHPMLKALHGSK